MSSTGHDPLDPRFSTAKHGTPIPIAAGIPVLMPEPKTHVYRAATAEPVASAALALTFTPVAQGVSVSIAVGAGPVAVAAVGSVIQVTALQAGTTTYANLKAAWDAAPAVVALATLTGDAGTFPAGYAGMAATALSTVRPSNADGMVGLCTDGVWRPVKLTTDGSIEVSVTIGDTIKAHLYKPVAGATETQEAAVTGELPEAKVWTYDTGLTATFTPYINGLSVGVSDTGAESVTYAGNFITVTVNGGVTTDASLAATWAASDAAAVCGLTMDAGTVPAAATYGPTELFTDRTVAAGATLGFAPDGAYIPTIVDGDGNQAVRPYLIPIGAATTPTSASKQDGVTGRLPKDYTYTISAGNDITIHPLQGGVSVIVTTGAAAAASATGSVVTLTNKNDDSTTVADMQALIAAGTAAQLLTITGTAGDLFDHLLTLAETPLWATGTIPAGGMMALDEDGNWSPFVQSSGGGMTFDAARKYAGVDAGAVTVTDVLTLGFTGVNLLGKALYALDVTTGTQHTISSVTDPVGATAGVIDLEEPLASTGDTVIVAYTTTPHAWNSAADATQTLAVAGDPPRVNGPATFISTTAAIADGTTQYIIPCSMYGRQAVQIVWSRAAGTRTIVFNAYGKIDTAAWAAAGAIPAAYLINGATDWHYSAGSTAFGAAAAGSGIILAWTDEPRPWNSIAIEMVVTNTDANNSTVTANYVLYGGTK